MQHSAGSLLRRDSRESDTIRIASPWLPPAKMWHTDCEPNCDKEAGKMKCSRLSLPVRPAVHHQGTDVANVADEAACRSIERGSYADTPLHRILSFTHILQSDRIER